MTEPVAFKYRAFLSYSHKDSVAANRFHSQLEAFHIDRDLVGRQTGMGPIPKFLRGTIFRDRNDFDVGAALEGLTKTALEASAALVVLCSPHSAKSGPVNEEVRLFKAHHPDRPVIPVILEGSPEVCYPPAIFLSIIGADVRPIGDGQELALAKVVAKLLDLKPDDVYRRAVRWQRRQQRRLLAAALGLSGIAGALAVWQTMAAQERESAALASLARRASDDGMLDRAARYAIAALPPDGATPLFPWPNQAEAALQAS